MTRTFFGSLGLVALFVAIVVGMYGAFSSKPPTESGIAAGLEATTETTNRQAEQGGQAAASIGQTVTAGDVSWTVTDASLETELHKYTFPPTTAHGRYVSIDFTVENVSDRPVTLTEDDLVIFDSAGNEFLPEADRNLGFVEHELNILFNERSLLKPGETKEGKVNFEVLENSSGFRAQLGDTDPTVNEEEYVDLGV